MSRHMILWNEGHHSDSIRVYTEDPAVLVTSERKDLSILKEIPEANKAGIYILLGKDKRYVGQASSSVWSRISTHDKNKDWWSKVLFFSRVDGHLDKSQLDYLENKLIKQFTSASFEMDNKDTGNSSYIGPYQRGQAESLLSIIESILLKDIGIDIFKKTSRRKRGSTVISSEVIQPLEDLPKVPTVKPLNTMTSEKFGKFENKIYRSLYIDYVNMAWVDNSEILSERMLEANMISYSKLIEEHRLKFYVGIDKEWSLFTNCSKEELNKRIQKVAGFIGDEVKTHIF